MQKERKQERKKESQKIQRKKKADQTGYMCFSYLTVSQVIYHIKQEQSFHNPSTMVIRINYFFKWTKIEEQKKVNGVQSSVCAFVFVSEMEFDSMTY